MRHVAIFAICLFSLSSTARADDAIYKNLISQYKTACAFDADFEIADDGTYSIQFGPKNSITAYVVNPQTLTCNNQKVSLCGTRGCELKVYVKGQTYEMLGWHVSSIQVELQSVLLVEQSGNVCDFDLPNAEPCYALWEWSNEKNELKFLR